jgi:hypothetical protein
VSAVHPEMPLANHRVPILSDVVKIFRLVVVPQVVQVHHVKHVMDQTHVVRDQLRWIEINLVYAHEFLNQIFLKMLPAKS